MTKKPICEKDEAPKNWAQVIVDFIDDDDTDSTKFQRLIASFLGVLYFTFQF